MAKGEPFGANPLSTFSGLSGPQRVHVFADLPSHFLCSRTYARKGAQAHLLRLNPDEIVSNLLVRSAVPKLPSGVEQIHIVFVCGPAVVRSADADWVPLGPPYLAEA